MPSRSSIYVLIPTIATHKTSEVSNPLRYDAEAEERCRHDMGQPLMYVCHARAVYTLQIYVIRSLHATFANEPFKKIIREPYQNAPLLDHPQFRPQVTSWLNVLTPDETSKAFPQATTSSEHTTKLCSLQSDNDLRWPNEGYK